MLPRRSTPSGSPERPLLPERCRSPGCGRVERRCSLDLPVPLTLVPLSVQVAPWGTRRLSTVIAPSVPRQLRSSANAEGAAARAAVAATSAASDATLRCLIMRFLLSRDPTGSACGCRVEACRGDEESVRPGTWMRLRSSSLRAGGRLVSPASRLAVSDVRPHSSRPRLAIEPFRPRVEQRAAGAPQALRMKARRERARSGRRRVRWREAAWRDRRG